MVSSMGDLIVRLTLFWMIVHRTSMRENLSEISLELL
jgi:hypothetical protein